MKLFYSGAFVLLVSTIVCFLYSNSTSYPNYEGAPACDDCHSGFLAAGPLHQQHLVLTADCFLCHTTLHDNPPLDNCGGCHLGDGLRLHHTNAGAPPDADGKLCSSCHDGDPAPPGENTIPPYYLLANVTVKAPCSGTPAPPGEDFNGDGKGLDNDGDSLYDDNDPDCSVPVEKTTWGKIRALYKM